MNEELPKPFETITEQIPTIEEITAIFEQVLKLAGHEEKYETERQFEDEKGIYLWTIKVQVETGYHEYEYIRKGRYEKNENHGTVADTETSICVVYYNQDAIPDGGASVAKFLNGKWEILL